MGLGFLFFFFFQAEDGIRDRDVTGVQTCAFRSLSIDKIPFLILITLLTFLKYLFDSKPVFQLYCPKILNEK